MTTLKIDGTIGSGALAAIESRVPRIYADPSLRTLAVVELAHVERVQPAPDTDKEPSVKVRIALLEVPSPAQEDAIRDAMRALYVQRTAVGTLDEHDELRLSQLTLDRLGDDLQYHELARVAAGAKHWQGYAAEVAAKTNPTVTDLSQEIRIIRDGLLRLVRGTEDGKTLGGML